MDARIIKNRLILLLAIFLLSACKEDEIATFESESNVYFTLQRWFSSPTTKTYTISDYSIPDQEGVLHSFEWVMQSTPYDSIKVSFALQASGNDRLQLIPVNLMGDIVDYDRELSYTIGQKSEVAENDGFRIVDARIPAGKNLGSIAVLLEREIFKDTTYVIDFELRENEYFQTKYKSIVRSLNDTTKVDLLKFRLVVSDLLLQPDKWASSYFGKFSRKKVYLVIELTKGDIEDFYVTSPNLALMNAWGSALKNYLAEMQAAGTPVLEEDGTPMTVTP